MRRKCSKPFTNTQARVSLTRSESRLYPHRTVCSSLSSRAGFSHTPQAVLLQARLSADTLSGPTTLAPQLVARSTKEMATIADLRCHSLASFATYQTAEPLLRLSGDTPDSRSSGAIRFNASRRAGCEGERDGRGSHVASLKRGGWWGACNNNNNNNYTRPSHLDTRTRHGQGPTRMRGNVAVNVGYTIK